MLELSSKHLLIIGLGKSGLSVADRARRAGANVWGYDDKLSIKYQRLPRSSDKSESLAMTSLRGAQPTDKATWQSQPTTNHQPPTTNFDLVVTSPGIPFDHPVLRLAVQKKWPVISEIEFAYLLLEPQFVIGITGTNGKTTVVEMLSHVFKLSGKPYTVAGNIGAPLSSFSKIKGTLILELSSFQLHFIDAFRANIGVLLNVEQDHLDWHCCFGQYLKDKLRVFKNQQKGDVAIIGECLPANKMGPVPVHSKLVSFSSKNSADYCLKEGYLTAYGEKIIAAKDMKLKGLHNIANVLAVMACAKETGIESRFIKEGINGFEGLDHRLQFVAEKGGIQFFNDSKATNPDSTHKAIESFNLPLILIMGGRNKGNDFSFLKRLLGGRVKDLVIYGEAADEIRRQAGAGHVTKTVDQALTKAVQLAPQNSVVLFSPGCASFDLFENYAKRGEAFIRVVKELDG